MDIKIVKVGEDQTGRQRICPWLLDVPPPAPEKE